MSRRDQSEWLCVDCGHVLGHMLGGELQPTVKGEQLMTRGPNLVVTCPSCDRVKTFYTSDPVVRSMYQLVDAISTAMAGRMIYAVGKAAREEERKNK